MESLNPCSFQCLKSVAVMVCVWLQPFLFFTFLLQHSLFGYEQLVFQFLWLISLILLTLFFSQIRIFNTFSRKTYFLLCSGFGIFFKLLCCCFAYKIKSRCHLLKTMAILVSKNIRFSLLFATGDVSRGGTSVTRRQKFHTDDANQCLNNMGSKYKFVQFCVSSGPFW